MCAILILSCALSVNPAYPEGLCPDCRRGDQIKFVTSTQGYSQHVVLRDGRIQPVHRKRHDTCFNCGHPDCRAWWWTDKHGDIIAFGSINWPTGLTPKSYKNGRYIEGTAWFRGDPKNEKYFRLSDQ